MLVSIIIQPISQLPISIALVGKGGKMFYTLSAQNRSVFFLLFHCLLYVYWNSQWAALSDIDILE